MRTPDDACRLIDQAIRSEPAYAHTSHLLLEVGGDVVFDRHYRGPRVADVFWVTKSVVATLCGIAVREGRLGDLDLPVGLVLPRLAGTPAAAHTVRQLLTMTRGAEADGPFEIDEVMALPGGGWTGSRPLRSWTRRGPGPGTTTVAPTCSAPSWARPSACRWPATPGRGCSRPWGSGGAGRGTPTASTTAPGISGWPRPTWPSWAGCGATVAAGGRQLLDPAFAAGWAGQLVAVVPAAQAVVVVTGDPRFNPGPPPTHRLPPGWRPAAELVAAHLLPALLEVA